MGWTARCFVYAADAEQNPTEQQATEPMETTVPETEPAETEPSVTEVPATEPTVTEPTVTEPPATEPPATEPPATDTPATEPPATDTPATEPPATEPPATDTPATEPPATDTPATEPPATEPPATESDATEPFDMALTDALNDEINLLTESVADPTVQDGDLGTVVGQGITFRLYNYSTAINKAAGAASWRTISQYFTFRNSRMESGTDAESFNIPSPGTNAQHDQDGYTKFHATVERVLNGGYPVLDLTRNADGSSRTNPGISKEERSLRYLFSAGDHAVTAYSPGNTILQQSGSHFWYNSADHAVDYDPSDNRFRLRNYVERNSTTAGYGASYGDFLPFTYTGGIQLGSTEDGAAYHVDTLDTDYWFGMTMQVNFFQTKGGRLGDQNMIFRFSGDDDVWVFVDDVLVLDLGGTHGTVDGSINFATGEVLQYLSWGGANATETEKTLGSSTSFPTTIRECFDAAGRIPNGGWSTDGKTFADFSEHTLKFFYLERGSAVANCSLDFRLPTLPDESLTVTKDLSIDENGQVRDYIADSFDYRFRVMKVDNAGNITGEPFITAGMTYSLLEDGVKTGSGTVGEDNSFLLRAGQSAQFTQMLRKGNGATAYVVEEIMPDDLTGQYAGVEYLISGIGGETITENDPEMPFTAFQTGVLSADQTQTVTFRNRVDTDKLGTLKITKHAAAGTQIPEDLYFQMRVKLGGKLLPVGTAYSVGDTRRTVETAGVLCLRANETAVVEQGILSGTTYQVTELSASFDGYRPTYSGEAEPAGEVDCNEDGASGTFPVGATVQITVTNADYDFALQIPIRKKVLDFQGGADFSFAVEQVESTGDDWQVIETLPEIRIAVTDSQIAEETITIGYRFTEEGVFYYRIREIAGNESFLYDTGIYIVEVTVSDGKAVITGIERDEKQAESVMFVNRVITSLTVTKTVTGAAGSVRFPFTVEVFLDGVPFLIPENMGSKEYAVNGNRISFSLGHGESITLPCIPMHAVVTVEEHDHDGFLVFTQLEAGEESQTDGAERTLYFDDAPRTIHFKNQCGYRLPNTGGIGTTLYTAGGTTVSLSMGAALLYKKMRNGRRKAAPPEA